MLSKSDERHNVGGRAAVIDLNQLVGVSPGDFYIVAGAGSKTAAAEAALRVYEGQRIHQNGLTTPARYSAVEIHPAVYIVCVVAANPRSEDSGYSDNPEPPGGEERWDGEVSGEVFEEGPKSPL